MSKKALLIICDGWGIGDKGKDDVIFNTPTPYWDELLKTYPASQLQASGENVGLPDGQMGNSEVGHLNIGAGRIVYQDLVKINIACRENTIMENPEIKRAYGYAKENNKQIHFMGLVSDGGVHSSLEHLLKLTDIAKEYGISKTAIYETFHQENVRAGILQKRGRPRKNTERNALIAKRHREGEKVQALATEYNLSVSTVNTICSRNKNQNITSY